jgi:membrane associated rhomboid family serine protease
VTASTVACQQCGALNEQDFGRCIRCNAKLDGAVPADKAKRRVPAPRRPRQGGVAPKMEPFLGRFDATELPAAKLIVGINFVIFAIHIVHAAGRSSLFGVLLSGGSPLEAALYGAFRAGSLAWVSEEPWRLISANWVHFGAIHFGFNMLGVVHLSRLLEPAIGSHRYLVGYVITGIAGFAASAGWEISHALPNNPGPYTAGASASLFGAMGMVLGFLWRRKDPRWKAWLGQAVMYSVVFGFVIRANNAAHIGGLIVGIPFGVAYGTGPLVPARAGYKIVAWVLVLVSVGSVIAARFSPYHDALMELLTKPT